MIYVRESCAVGGFPLPRRVHATFAVPLALALVLGVLVPPAPLAEPASADAPALPVEVRGAMRLLEGPAYEPTVGVTPAGTILYSGATPQAPPGETESWVFASYDEGATWANTTGGVAPRVVAPDPFLYVDPDTSRIFRITMSPFGSQRGCLTLLTSDDEARSWVDDPEVCISPPFHDHPSLATGKPRGALLPVGDYPNLVHVCINHVQGTMCATSLDAAQTFLAPVMVFPAVSERGFCGGLNSPVTTDAEGRVYVPRLHCDVPRIARSDDGGLTWTLHTLPGPLASRGTLLPSPLSGAPDVPYIDTNVMHMAVDASGALHVVYVAADGLPYHLWSRDHAETWSAPRLVAAPGVTAVGLSLVTVAAGAEGHVAIAYVGTDHPGGYAAPSMDGAAWSMHLGVLTDAFGAGEVAWARVNEASGPIGVDDCGLDRCMEPCPGICPGMYDYIDLALSPDGRPWVAFVDVCHETCALTGEHDRARAALGTLATGPSLTRPGAALAPLGWGA